VLGQEDAVLAGVASLLAPAAEAAALVSVTPHDGVPPVPAPDVLAAAYARHGLCLVERRPATRAEVDGSGSSRVKRLGAVDVRPTTLLRVQRPSARSSAARAA
jgi:hypothetical protein